MRSPAATWAAVAFLGGVGVGLAASLLYVSSSDVEQIGDASTSVAWKSEPGPTDTTQLAADRNQAPTQRSRSGSASRPVSPQEIYEDHNRIIAEYRRAVEEQDTEKLLAAGFSQDRIDWLRKRAAELQAAKRAEETERRRRGLPPDPVLELPFFYDESIGLRQELGDDEYARYLEALGRPTSISVSEVLGGSVADSLGLRPGDKILSYGGKRLFNFGELLAEQTMSQRSSANSEVVVERDGQQLHFVVPGGALGVRAPSQPIDVSDKIVRALRDAEKARE